MCRLSCFPGAVVQETVEISGIFLGPVHRYRARGRVHRDTAPIIRCMRWLSWINMVVIHTGPHPPPPPQQQQQHSSSDRLVTPFLCVLLVMDELSGQPMSAAQLRSMLRHEQQSIRMALATVMHHSYKVHTEYGALRGLKTATRAGEEGREEHNALRRQRPPLPQTGALPAVRRGARREAADRSGRAAGAIGAGSEAHRGADGRRRSHGADPRCSCAADGGTRCGRPEDL